MIELKLIPTYDGYAMWQQGGGCSRSGESLVIADPWGNPKEAVEVRTHDVDHNHHCLIQIENNDIVVMAKRIKGNTMNRVYWVQDNTLLLVNELKDGKWRIKPSPKGDRMIQKVLKTANNICKTGFSKATFFIKRN